MRNITVLILISLALSACGKDGRNGLDGPAGRDGRDGIDGTNGRDGADGSSCSTSTVPANNVAPNGGSLISCTDGTQSLVLNGTNGRDGNDGQDGINGQDGQDGNDGADGRDGADGHDGTNGTNGTNGTIVAPVQFCPGVNHYPSTFPEVGFCINHKIYAVYSANGGFLTEVSPGNWSSNAIGSSCSFTVYDDCQVVSR